MINVAHHVSLFDVHTRARIEAPWLSIALREIGQRELGGFERNNPRIVQYLDSFPYLASIAHLTKDPSDPSGRRRLPTGHMIGDLDETAWCAAFVNWCLREAKQSTAGMNAGAQTSKRYGSCLPEPRLGAVAVIYKKPSRKTASMTRTGWHVGFYLGGHRRTPVLLGGNQRDSVCSKTFFGYTTIEYRWPRSTQIPVDPTAPNLA